MVKWTTPAMTRVVRVGRVSQRSPARHSLCPYSSMDRALVFGTSDGGSNPSGGIGDGRRACPQRLACMAGGSEPLLGVRIPPGAPLRYIKILAPSNDGAVMGTTQIFTHAHPLGWA